MKKLLHAIDEEMDSYFQYLTAQATANRLRAEWKKKHDYLHTLYLENLKEKK